MAQQSEKGWILLAALVAGLLLSFGAAVLLFDYAHSGPNTDAWQVLAGIVLPVILLGGLALRLRALGLQAKSFLLLGLPAVAGVLIGFAVIAVMDRMTLG